MMVKYWNFMIYMIIKLKTQISEMDFTLTTMTFPVIPGYDHTLNGC